MKDRDEIKELFSEKLGNYQAEVNPQLWGNIASQVAVSTGGPLAGISIFSKVIIGLSLISAIVLTAVIIKNNSNSDQNNDPIVEKSIIDEQRTEDKRTKQETVVDNKQVPLVERDDQEEIGLETSSQGNNETGDTEVVPTTSNDLIEGVTNPNTDKIVEPETNIVKIVEPENNNATDSDVKKEDPKEIIITNETIVENQTHDPANATYNIESLPNIFSPNNDGENDFFHIKSEGLEEFNIVVLNNKSKVVYQSNNPDFMGDGNDFSGNPVPSGYNVRYVYYITARDKNGHPVNKGSSLRVMR